MTTPLRIALFSDAHYEANGVARTTGALERYASRRNMPLLSVHAGPAARTSVEGSVVRLELKRWRLTSFALEHDLRFDLSMWRCWGRVLDELRRFNPDVLHFTGPSDIGQLGAYLGYRLGIPMVGSWHTNLHEYASRRLRLPWLGDTISQRVRGWAERESFRWCLLFYRIPRVILAPHDEWVSLLGERTGKPTFPMSRGVDTEMFSPSKRRRTDSAVNIGYVGRLSPEKSVRQLVQVRAALDREGCTSVRFTIVGDGTEREWLARHLRGATFRGVLRGEALAEAYADMDLFVFPSETETVGNVVLEAMASGVPVVAMARGGPRFITTPGLSAVLARDHSELVALVPELVRDDARREGMRVAARAHAMERSWDQVFDAVYQAYAVAVSLGDGERHPAIDDPVAEGADA